MDSLTLPNASLDPSQTFFTTRVLSTLPKKSSVEPSGERVMLIGGVRVGL